ncbi:MAG: protein kinase [Candidatus Berkiella sp.]
MPFQTARDAITALDELTTNIRKNSPSASTEQIQYTIQNWSRMHFTASEADAKILVRVQAVLHQDKIAVGQGMLGFSNENASFLKAKAEALEGADFGIFFKSFAEPKKTPGQEAAERLAKEKEKLESERQALQSEQQSIQEMLIDLKTIGPVISSAIPMDMKHIPFSQLKKALDPKIKEHESVLKLINEFESLKSNLDDYVKNNNNSQIRILEGNIREGLGNRAQMSMTIDFIRQNMPLLMEARQWVQRIEFPAVAAAAPPLYQDRVLFEQSIANAKTAGQLAGVIWNFNGNIINSQGVVMDNKKMASSVSAILSNKEMVAQIVANNGLTIEQVRDYGLTGAHGIYGKFMQLVTQKHEENLRADADFRQKIGTANNLKELIEIIRAHPGELSAQNGQPLNKATMIHRLEMIANQPAILKSVVDGIYPWGGSELTGNYGLRNKIQECAQKEYIAKYEQALPATKDGLFKVEPTDWAKAMQYFDRNPSATKCDKKANGLDCSFIKVGDAIYAIKTGPCLGEGAFGKVKTVQNMNGENFAVKIEGRTKRGDLDSEVKIMKVLGELQGEADRVYGKPFKGQYAQNKLYTVMKLKEGNELFEELYMGKKRGAPPKSLPDSQRLLLAIKAAEAIKVLHDKNIIHADIKPENFMANVKGENIVIGAIDFGFSMMLAPGQDRILGAAKGSPIYCAPEIVQIINGNVYGRNPAAFSKASDLYAIGKMFLDDFGLNMGADFYNRILNFDPRQRPTMPQLLDELYTKLAMQPNLSVEVKMMVDNYLRERKVAHPQEKQDSKDLIAKLQSANSLDALIKVINDYPWDIKNSQGTVIDKQKMVAAMSEIIANPEKVSEISARGMSIEAARAAGITGTYGIYGKFMTLVHAQHQLNVAAKAREEAQSSPSANANKLIGDVRREINFTHMQWGIRGGDRREEFIKPLLEKLDVLVNNKDMSSEQKLQGLNTLLQEAMYTQEPGADNFKRIVKNVFEIAKENKEFAPHAKPQQQKAGNVQPQNNSPPVASEPQIQQPKSAPQQDSRETKGLLSIKKKDWEKAKQYFADNPQAVKFAKKGNKISNSFIQVDGEIFAVKSGKCLGEGAFGKVKILQNEEKVNFAVKIEGRGKRGNDDAELKAMKLIGQLKGEAARSYGKTFKGEYAPEKLYTVMQLHKGKELWEQLYTEVARGEYAEKNISEEKKLLFAVKAAEAIKYLHDNRIIHADIKPQNFMANAKGNLITVGAIDFGFAMILPPGQDKIIGDSAKGTPGFAAPEVYHREYSFASDIYALGVMYKEDFGIDIPNILSKDPAQRPNMDQLLEQLYKKLEAASHLSNTTKDLLEQRKVDKIPDLLSMNKENIEDLYKFHSRSHSSSSVGRWMSNLHKDAGKAVFGKEKIRQEQIQLLSDCIAHVNKDPGMDNDKKAEKIYAILIKIESEVGQEHNTRKSGMKEMIQEQKQNLEAKYPALKDPQKAEAVRKAGMDILKEVRPEEARVSKLSHK